MNKKKNFSFRKRWATSLILWIAFSVPTSVYSAETPATLADFWNDQAQLSEPELVNFVGNPASHDLWTLNLRALVNVDSRTIYGYFGQLTAPFNPDILSFEMYMAISTDGGKTFEVQPNPIIPQQNFPGTGYLTGRLNNAYDPDVIKLDDGYYMVFEGAGSSSCTFSTFIAYSSDGIHNWQVKGVPVCAPDWNHSASTPNFAQDATTRDLYLQWVNVDDISKMVTHHQIKMDSSNLFKTLTTDVSYGQLPQDPTGSWDERNFGSGNVIYENGYYYLFADGSSGYGCGGSRWGIGMSRTATLANVQSWVKSATNPFLQSVLDSSCWLQYPEIIKIGDDYYLYYQNAFPYWSPSPGDGRTVFRSKIIRKPEGNSATYISQNIPNPVRPNQSFLVSITMKNTGTNSWIEGGKYQLGSQNPVNNFNWGINRINLANNETVRGLGQNCSYLTSLGGGIKGEPAMASIESRYIVVAQGLDDKIWTKEWMLDPGSGEIRVIQNWYRVDIQTSGQLKFMFDHGTLWLYTKSIDGNTYRSYYRAHGAAETSNWSLFENLGNTNFGISGPQIAYSYKVYNVNNSVALAKCLPDGDTKTFTFSAVAPTIPGTYNFQWRMVQDDIGWFGDTTPNVAVIISSPCNTITASNFSQSAYNSYGAPYDLFASNAQLVDATCTSADTHTVNLTTGITGDTTRIVYTKGYWYDAPGTAWRQYTGTCTGALNGEWCQGSVSAIITDPNVSTASSANPTYLVGMTCSVQGGSWRCGCRDTSCTNFYWQIQGAGL